MNDLWGVQIHKMNNNISIVLHYEDGLAKQITVDEFDQVSILQKYVSNSGNDRLIVANNSVLMPAFSFKYHGIKDGDHVHLIRTRLPRKGTASVNRSNASQQYWKRRIQMMTKSDAMLEAARIMDLRLNKMQWCWSPVLTEEVVQEKLERPSATILIQTETARNAPSCEALPCNFVTN